MVVKATTWEVALNCAGGGNKGGGAIGAIGASQGGGSVGLEGNGHARSAIEGDVELLRERGLEGT